MKITSEWLREKKACNLGDAEEMAYVDSVQDVYIILEKLKSLGRYNDAYWLLTRLFPDKMTCVKFGYFSAKNVFHIFENEFPADKRLREVLDAVGAWIKNPNKENQEKCKIAAYDATVYDAFSDASDAAYYAAVYAARADASYIESGAYTAFPDAAYAAYAVYAAAAYAAFSDAAFSDAAAGVYVGSDGEEIKEQIYQYGLELLRKETYNEDYE